MNVGWNNHSTNHNLSTHFKGAVEQLHHCDAISIEMEWRHSQQLQWGNVHREVNIANITQSYFDEMCKRSFQERMATDSTWFLFV